MQLSKSQINSIQNYFKTKPVLKVYLFGSFVKNNATISSDIDLLVELDYSKKIGLEFVQMKLDLQEILKKQVDLISNNAISKYMKVAVDREKQLLYVK